MSLSKYQSSGGKTITFANADESMHNRGRAGDRHRLTDSSQLKVGGTSSAGDVLRVG